MYKCIDLRSLAMSKVAFGIQQRYKTGGVIVTEEELNAVIRVVVESFMEEKLHGFEGFENDRA